MIRVAFYLAIAIVAVIVVMIRAFVDGIKHKNSVFIMLGVILLSGVVFTFFAATSLIMQM